MPTRLRPTGPPPSGPGSTAIDLYRFSTGLVEAPCVPHAQFGPDPLEVAADRIALAAILDAQGRHREAEVTLRDVLSVFERVLGRDHYEVALALDRLAAVVRRSGDDRQAFALCERSLAIKRRILGTHHADVAETLCAFGGCRCDLEHGRRRR